jgi:hypothetical protein
MNEYKIIYSQQLNSFGTRENYCWYVKANSYVNAQEVFFKEKGKFGVLIDIIKL